jgi:hypothetical protein
VITKKELLDGMVIELQICKRLFKKIPKSKFNYRPAKDMRSTAELLRYISFCATECARIHVVDAFKTNNWDAYSVAEKKARTLKPAQFPAAIDRQIGDLKRLMAKISERDFANKKVLSIPKGKRVPMHQAMAQAAGRFVSGYRMQLYLYAKASGGKKLGTADCWFNK